MIYNKEINGVKFTLVCETWNTRNSWWHEVTLYKNDTFKVGRAKYVIITERGKVTSIKAR